MSLRVATDIGGTFTDLVFFDEDATATGLAKALTRPGDLAQGVLDTITLANLSTDAFRYFIHGCTVVINAITERKGVKTALVTTSGFRDVLEIGRGNRPDLYNMRFEKPRPFVPRHLRFEVEERVDQHGTVLKPLRMEDVEEVVRRCRDAQVQAIAVCYLHAYANPDHELRTAQHLRRQLPRVAVTVSSDVTREWREYERSTTAVLNAYVQPIAEAYLDNLERAVSTRGDLQPHVMQSNGGTTTFALAKRRPIQLIESGPVAGVIGAAAVGRLVGEPNVISLDIGGTTAKCSLVEASTPKVTTEYKLFQTRTFPGYPVKVPVVDIVEIGAGGGSIARFDPSGALQVGPVSAGADPGPASYGRGGTEPTVTDAMLLTNVLNPDYFLGGRLRLDRDQAHGAMAKIARGLGISVEAAAVSVVRLVNANMINALKLVSVQRGHDPRDFVLVASGGGGPMHVAALAQELGVKAAIVPNYPGCFSAWGMLMTEPRIDLIRTQLRRTAEVTLHEVEGVFAEMAREILAQYAADRVAAADVRFVRSLDARYHGQDHTVPVALDGALADVDRIAELFHAAHKKAYTFDLPDTPVEVVNYRLTGYHLARRPDLRKIERRPGDPPLKGRRVVDFGDAGVAEAIVLERDTLPAGFQRSGPAIVEEASSTTVVPPGGWFEVDEWGQLHIRLEREP
ncbi:MAG: 5-oxoprolinase [Candidatus Rokuibacteriota bacterium]|nr:MAG: 5-oxoprolinase [Candidatus Rokubacteria bacterium]PYN69709.1 MAG: 5-oxoprolinase [Candidatus Rokubacteria bacterium]